MVKKLVNKLRAKIFSWYLKIMIKKYRSLLEESELRIQKNPGYIGKIGREGG